MTAPARIGVNLLWLRPGVVGGSEEYTTRLLRALAEAPERTRDLHLTLFVLPAFVEAHPDLVAAYPTVTATVDGRRRPERVAAEASWLAREAGRRRIDLLHHAGGVVPPGPAIGRIPSVLTIHDLQPLELPENFAAVKRRWLTSMLPRSAARARRVLTPSEPASRSVVRLLGVAPDRVDTVPHGVAAWDPVPAGALAEVQLRYRLTRRSILYPAITYPHKDHRTLVAAFARLVGSRPDLTLVLTGGRGPAEAELVASIRGLGIGDRIRRPGRVPGEDLRALYELATVVAVPSRYEGFGAPALEAMAGGTPVVAADATALPWVIGDAGRLVAPGDVAGWVDALGSVLDDRGEQERLRAAGRVRAASFSWERAGAALAAGYRRALGVGEDGRR